MQSILVLSCEIFQDFRKCIPKIYEKQKGTTYYITVIERYTGIEHYKFTKNALRIEHYNWVKFLEIRTLKI